MYRVLKQLITWGALAGMLISAGASAQNDQYGFFIYQADPKQAPKVLSIECKNFDAKGKGPQDLQCSLKDALTKSGGAATITPSTSVLLFPRSTVGPNAYCYCTVDPRTGVKYCTPPNCG